MKKLLLFVVFTMAVSMIFSQTTTPDPTGQNRYSITAETKPLNIFDIPKYDENDADFFDGWTSKTAEELGLVGQEFWNEFGKVARKGYVEKGAVFRIPNGFQWKEAYLEGCRVGPEKKIFYNRVWFPHKIIAIASPDKTPAPDKVVKTDAATIYIYNYGGQGGQGGQGGNVTNAGGTPMASSFPAPSIPGQQFVSIPTFQPNCFNPCYQQPNFFQQPVYYCQQNRGYYWLEGARLVFGTAVQFAQIFANRSPQVVTVNNENVVYNYIIKQQTSNPVAYIPPVNTNTGHGTPPICQNTGLPAEWHDYGGGVGEWKCKGYDTPGTNIPGPGTTPTNPGTNNPGQTPQTPGTPGTNEPGGLVKVNTNSNMRTMPYSTNSVNSNYAPKVAYNTNNNVAPSNNMQYQNVNSNMNNNSNMKPLNSVSYQVRPSNYVPVNTYKLRQ